MFALVRQGVQQVGFVSDDAGSLVVEVDALRQCSDEVAAAGGLFSAAEKTGEDEFHPLRLQQRIINVIRHQIIQLAHGHRLV